MDEQRFTVVYRDHMDGREYGLMVVASTEAEAREKAPAVVHPLSKILRVERVA